MRAFKLAALTLCAGAFIFALSACGGKYPRPSREFYVGDFADALLPGTREVIRLEGERLYKETRGQPDGGAQLVVATILLEEGQEEADIDRTELFRRWRIGDNDMGLLLLLLLRESADGEALDVVSAQIEIGYRMETYVTAARAGYILDNYLYNPDWQGSLDMGVGEAYYELLSTVYTGAYGYSSFDYDMENFADMVLSFSGTGEQVPMGFIAYILSPYSSWGGKAAMAAVALLLGGGGFGFLRGRNRGGGGSSGGYGAGR